MIDHAKHPQTTVKYHSYVLYVNDLSGLIEILSYFNPSNYKVKRCYFDNQFQKKGSINLVVALKRVHLMYQDNHKKESARRSNIQENGQLPRKFKKRICILITF